MIQYFPNIIFTFLVSFFLNSKYENDDIKAYWQPPGYVFGIVWPILYLLFGFINYSYSKAVNTDNNIVMKQSYFEAMIQTLWLLVTSRGEEERTSSQYIIGLFVLGFCCIYAYMVRLPTFYLLSNYASYFYLPYLLWIFFAFILNAQLVYISLTS